MSANGNGHQWSKFWWGDWQNDKALQGCSLGARGLWIEILAVCHASERPGYFLINGMPPTIQEMADMFGKTKPSEVSKFLDELCRRKIYSLEGDVIYCRRMVRDAEASEKGREAVERRWKTNGLDHGAPPGPITPPNRSPNTQPTTEPNRSPIREPNTKKLEAEAERKEGAPPWFPPQAGGSNPRRHASSPRTGFPIPRRWRSGSTSAWLRPRCCSRPTGCGTGRVTSGPRAPTGTPDSPTGCGGKPSIGALSATGPNLQADPRGRMGPEIVPHPQLR